MATAIPPAINKLCPVCARSVSRSRATYCSELCRRKAEYRRLKPKIYAYHAAHREQIRRKQREWVIGNPDKIRASRLRARPKRLLSLKAWKARNPDRVRELKRESAKRCSVTCNARSRKWRAANPIKARAFRKKWAQNNRGLVTAKTRRRQAAQLQAVPSWLTEHDFMIMESLYKKAAANGLEGDHIIPLQGKTVCGLHTPDNLQLLSREANRAKSNHLLEDAA